MLALKIKEAAIEEVATKQDLNPSIHSSNIHTVHSGDNYVVKITLHLFMKAPNTLSL